MDFTILDKLVDFLNEPNLPQVETSREDDEKKEEENKIEGMNASKSLQLL